MAEVAMRGAPPLSRREFLFYIWAASMTLSLAGSTGAVLWFAYPRFRAGEFGGIFTLDPNEVPASDADPRNYDRGRFWLTQVEGGVLAHYVVCVHLGCLYKWVPSNHRFECPCHGSKFELDGTWIEGPAPRSLDRFVIQAEDVSGRLLAETRKGDANVDPSVGGPLPLPPGTVALKLDTGVTIRGRNHA